MKTQISKQHTNEVAVQPQTTFHKEDRRKKQNFTTLKLAIFFAMAVTMALSAYAQEEAAQTAPPPSNQQLSPEDLRLLDEWQVSISQVPAPKKGCFEAQYPDKEWHEIACIPAPTLPMGQKQGPRPLIVGNGNDVSAEAPTGRISTATGKFDTVTGVTSVSSNYGSFTVPNAYTLQLNSNFFKGSSLCPSPSAGCAWEQFVYENDGSGLPFQGGCSSSTHACVYIQYWMFGLTSCPVGWLSDGVGDCYKNSPAAGAQNPAISQLNQLSLSGVVTATSDEAIFFVGTVGTMSVGDNSVHLAAGWLQAEYNMVGDCCASGAVFNNGADMQIRNSIVYGGTAPPNCVAVGFTGETNNLSFPLSPPAPSAPGPALLFDQNAASSGSANCAAATSVGDTHLYTAMGLHYDFQASGDFVVAQEDPDFLVEARQVSGAPTWPNAAVNHDIAAQMGLDTVAVCGPTQFGGSELFVNGRFIELGDGQVYSTPNGVDIWRVGDAYNATDQSGNSVNAVVNTYSPTSWINLTIGLGHWPANLTGLAANANQDVNQIAAKEGFVLTAPFAFGEFYHVYGQSWRSGFDGEDLLSVCGEQTEIGNPLIPFYGRQLPPRLYEQSRAVCTTAGVIGDALLDACTLDIGVIGNDAAAQVYVNARQPVAVGNIVISPTSVR